MIIYSIYFDVVKLQTEKNIKHNLTLCQPEMDLYAFVVLEVLITFRDSFLFVYYYNLPKQSAKFIIILSLFHPVANESI